ncbi:DUF2975 domain-containing protein [uncultured Bacteroides sp.]|uniref:DUF2975 domain-containing protein n=1 Tax=uncultured Bacteroides sp. TaxID=162156 RepID=UPI002AA65E70|nr:DUF2975 domain-containing protein [uncultured Bacteroides sp.]
MKRRLNILCVLVVLVLSYSVFETLFEMGMGFVAGVELVMDAHGKKIDSPAMDMKMIALMPKDLAHFSDSVYNERTNAKVPALYSQLLVSVKTKANIWNMLGTALSSLLEFATIAISIFIFIKLIVSINRSDIFNWKNVHRLRWLGGTLTFSFLCSVASIYINYSGLCAVFSIPGYSFHQSEFISILTLVLGIVSFIVGEIFAIGLKLKEEQDLTI